MESSAALQPDPEIEPESEPGATSDGAAAIEPQSSAEPEFVGGLPEQVPVRRRLRPLARDIVTSVRQISLRRALLAFGGLAVVVALILGAAWLWSDSRHEVLGFRPAASIEPNSTKMFTQALHRRDPVAMRAQVSQKCVADSQSALCFGAEDDQHFKSAMANDTVEVTFLRRFEDHTGTVVIYDLSINNAKTGRRQDLILVLRLAQNGKIDHALVS